MILIIDNYDSFTYNLVQLFESRGEEVLVKLNDQVSIEEIEKMKPDGIILSPGPCTPNEAGICIEVVKALGENYPILGVCLGHQVIGQAFGGKVVGAGRIIHGKTEAIHHSGQGLFENIINKFKATRYHSLIIEKQSMPIELAIMATADSDGMIMAIQHRQYPIYGLQFHPESYGTDYGKEMADNFIRLMKNYKKEVV